MKLQHHEVYLFVSIDWLTCRPTKALINTPNHKPMFNSINLILMHFIDGLSQYDLMRMIFFWSEFNSYMTGQISDLSQQIQIHFDKFINGTHTTSRPAKWNLMTICYNHKLLTLVKSWGVHSWLDFPKDLISLRTKLQRLTKHEEPIIPYWCFCTQWSKLSGKRVAGSRNR